MTLVLCEGERQSPDVQLLAGIIGGRAFVQPAGGRNGLPEAVESLQATGTNACAVSDGDLPRNVSDWSTWTPPTTLQSFSLRNRPVVGWRYPRKEVENYLLDPNVLQRTRGWTDSRRDSYAAWLDGVFDKMGPCVAAEMALTASFPTRTRPDLKVTPGADDATALRQLQRRVEDHNRGGSYDCDSTTRLYHQLLPLCRPGGRLREFAMKLFPGKNALALVSQERGWREQLPTANAAELADLVSNAMAGAGHTWLPEWQELVHHLDTWTFQPA